MSEINIFEEAVRAKLRFQTTKGLVSTEDLWDLSLAKLDEMAVAINKKIKETSNESFLKPKSAPDSELSLSLSILVYVLEKKQAEALARKNSEEKRAQKAKLLEILSSKQDAKLNEMSEEELLAKINSL